MQPLQAAVLIVALVGNSLLAGLFYAFACAIWPGFRQLPDIQFIIVFRQINASILNAWFLPVFVLTPLVSIAAVFTAFVDSNASWPLVAGTVCSVVSLLITAAVNVPLNNLLAARVIDTPMQQRRARREFEAPWNRWNVMRALANTAAVVLLAWTLAYGSP